METLLPFTESETYFKLGDPQSAYFDISATEVTSLEPTILQGSGKVMSVHLGARKLLFSEIAFFNRHWDATKIPQPRVLYIGAAPGYHLNVLTNMFPDLSFILYDEQPILPSGPKFKVVNELMFTSNIPQELINQPDVFFISDIRTPPDDQTNIAENQIKVDQNMKLQKEILNILQPVEALLKFRLKWPEIIKKQQTERERLFEEGDDYLDGIVYYQPWRPRLSTECRLVPVRDPETKQYVDTRWDSRIYQDVNFFVNTERRVYYYRYLNPLTGQDEPIDSPYLLQDFDSCLEATILRDYLLKVTGQEPVPEDVIALSRWVTEQLQINFDRFRFELQNRSSTYQNDMVSKRQEIIDMSALSFGNKPSKDGRYGGGPVRYGMRRR